MWWQTDNRERSDLWFAVVITILLAAYRLSIELVEPLSRLFEPYTQLPLAAWLSNLLFVWILLVLWIAYRRWRTSLAREQDLQKVFSSVAPDVFMVVNQERAIAMCSAGVASMFGYSVPEVVGQKTELLYFDRRKSGRPGEIREELERFGFHVGTATGKRKTGETFPIEIVTGDIRGRSGVIVLIRDVTERKKAEEEVNRARERADEANRQKERLLVELQANYEKLKRMEDLREKLTHMIVHDLKAPLSTINVYLEILKRYSGKKLDPREIQYLDEASTSVFRMAEMINSLLDISRLESQKMPINVQACDLGELTREAVGALGPAAKEKSVTVEVSQEPFVAFCDVEIIRRVIVNLVGNAVKFTGPDGVICVRLEREAALPRVTVADNGPGIDPAHHERIFERFGAIQAGKSSTGLGLTFCRLAIEAHGGRIGVQSEPGKGSTFWFVLPERPISEVKA